MNIIVTVPKNYNMKSKFATNFPYWRLSRWPKNAEPGDHIYFVHDDEVKFKALISDTQRGSEKGEIDFEGLEKLPEPRQKMKGFRGYQYYEGQRR